MSRSFILRHVEPSKPITFDPNKCISCNRCVNVCPIDILLPSVASGETPVVAYPDECWYCGCCVMECPTEAINLGHPLMNQVRWVEKESLMREGDLK